MFMRKAFLTVLLVSVIVFVSISFMGASCVVTPGPGPVLYTITLTNTFAEPVTIEVWDTNSWVTIQDSEYVPMGATRSVFGYYGQYFRVLGETIPKTYYIFTSTGNSWYMITGNKSFNGGWVTEAR